MALIYGELQIEKRSWTLRAGWGGVGEQLPHPPLVTRAAQRVWVHKDPDLGQSEMKKGVLQGRGEGDKGGGHERQSTHFA